MTNEKRKSERMEYCAAIQCSKVISEGKVKSFDPPVEMKVKNIAPEGLCISALESFEVGSLLKFDMMLKDVWYKEITATIIWTIKNKNTYDYGLHMQYVTGRFGVQIIEMGRQVFKKV
ncbi:type IV pilus assembly PilZ [Syntrophobotulus glycolicus DSM 8271]|uniref:Type IV pilus assembly PilZ n=2 Tax=Syntrophobotulus TaxID=51196 RepID=F0T2L3_SYNGF|nr:type IV pilus assembly PilZ [Syntrophobotulus glycolicus DSM 8271]